MKKFFDRNGNWLLASAVSSETEGRRLATLAFLGVDENMTIMRALKSNSTKRKISLSSWTDDNGNLTWQEFSTWGFGMEDVAVETGREQAYETARKVVFDLWDRSDDWILSAMNSAKA